MHPNRRLPLAAVLTVVLATPVHSADKPLKTFILAGQSNVVGYGDSTKLPNGLREGNDRVVMFENGKWQPLRPHSPATQGQKRLGLTEYHFGPEIAFGHEVAKAFPDETIGIIKHAVGGSSLLAWKPDWNEADAARVGQVGRGPLYKALMGKVKQAQRGRDIEIVGFLWLQGAGDMKKVDVAKEYLDNLKSFVAALRRDTGASDLPFLYGSARSEGYPDDLSDLVPELMEGRYPAAQWVVKAQFDAQKAIPHSKMVILRNIEKHPQNVHFNTAGQMVVGKLFAEAFLGLDQRIGGHDPQQILAMLGGKARDTATDRQLTIYRRIFGFIDANGDGQHSKKEFVDDGRYLTRQARQGIFRASDSSGDGIVTEEEYIENRIITDEAKAIFEEVDANNDGKLTLEELVATGKIKDEDLTKTVFERLDTDGDGELVVPEYLRVWGRWARSGWKAPAAVSK